MRGVPLQRVPTFGPWGLTAHEVMTMRTVAAIGHHKLAAEALAVTMAMVREHLHSARAKMGNLHSTVALCRFAAYEDRHGPLAADA